MGDVRRLDELCKEIVDCPHSTPVWTDTGVVVLRSHNIRGGRLSLADTSYTDEEHYIERIRRADPRPGDLVITREAPMGEVCMVPEGLRCCLGQRMVLLRPDETKVDGRYLLYALQSPQVQHEIHLSDGTGSTVSNLRLPLLRALAVPTPLNAEQRAIAGVLGAIDDQIEVNRRMAETLEEMARALFRSWFVDFEPVRAKADGRGSGLPAEIVDLFPDRLVNSPLGEIPDGWSASALDRLCELNPPRALRRGAPAPYLDMAAMPTQGHSAERWIVREYGSGMRFVNGDTLVARITPCLENGKTAFVDFLTDGEVGWGSTEYIVLRPREPLPVEWAYLLARSDEFRDFAVQRMSGSSGRQRVGVDSLAAFPVVECTEPVARAFGDAVRPLMTRATEAIRSNQPLVDLRDALLPKLVSGEVRIGDPVGFLERLEAVG